MTVETVVTAVRTESCYINDSNDSGGNSGNSDSSECIDITDRSESGYSSDTVVTLVVTFCKVLIKVKEGTAVTEIGVKEVTIVEWK